MLAAVFHAPNNIVVQQVPIRRRKAMLKVNACAVCGYDARVFRNGHRKVRPPVILGHELCGEIQNEIIAGDGLTTINAGSRVAVCPLVPCLQCPYCKIGDYNLCVDLREIGSTSDGGFAQYITIPDQLVRIGGLVPVPDNLTDEEAALLEPLACCLNSYYRMLPIAKESSIVIIGDGPMGLLHLQLFKRLLSSSRVAIVGKVPLRMEKARAMGADAVFAYSRETVPDVLDFAGASSFGAGVVVIATSNPVAFELATKVSARNSKINIFAGMPGGQTFLLDANWLHYNQISITGTFSSTPKMLREATRIASEKTIDLSSIVTHTYSLPEIEEAIEVTEKYHGLRAVINKF
jgi:L-iditol 2-dehydrogenase